MKKKRIFSFCTQFDHERSIFNRVCRLPVSLFESTVRFDVETRKKNNAGRIDLETLARKIVGSIEREIRGISRTRRKEAVSSLARYLSHLEFDAIRWKKKKEEEKKRKIVIGGSDGSEARGKRMGFNIAGSTEPDGDSYNGGARGLAKPYRLWVRDSTE